jgi:hypothetical protein
VSALCPYGRIKKSTAQPLLTYVVLDVDLGTSATHCVVADANLVQRIQFAGRLLLENEGHSHPVVYLIKTKI